MDEILLACQPYVTLVKDIITIASLTAAAIIAGMGLYTWKNQLIGTAEYELAKRILKATYRLRDTLENVRNPIIMADEEYRAVKEANIETDVNTPENERQRSVAVYNQRWKEVGSNFQDLQLEAIEAEAVWGTDVKNQVFGIRKSVIKLFTAIQMYHLYGFKPHRGESERQVVEKFEKIIYKIPGDEADEYSLELLAEVNIIENLVRPYLKRNHK